MHAISFSFSVPHTHTHTSPCVALLGFLFLCNYRLLIYFLCYVLQPLVSTMFPPLPFECHRSSAARASGSQQGKRNTICFFHTAGVGQVWWLHGTRPRGTKFWWQFLLERGWVWVSSLVMVVGVWDVQSGIYGSLVNECLGAFVCVCPLVVKFDLIIHVEAVTLLPKPANETPSRQGTHTGHSDQLLNENDRVSNAALAGARHTPDSCFASRGCKRECASAFFQWLGKVCHRCSL